MRPPPPLLTVQVLREQGILDTLATAFNNLHEATTLLGQIGYPKPQIPVTMVEPLHYWYLPRRGYILQPWVAQRTHGERPTAPPFFLSL